MKTESIEARLEIMDHGIRWSNNILIEILSNHALAVSREVRDDVREAVTRLESAQNTIRQIRAKK